MPHDFQISGLGNASLVTSIESALRRSRPAAIGVVSAFVSVPGVDLLKGILTRCGVLDCRLIAGIDHAITHPEALRMALEMNWQVRIGSSDQGIFHPKLIVAGAAFDDQGAITQPAFVYIGSSNLSAAGLRGNTECGLLATGLGYEASSNALCALWRNARTLDQTALDNYSRVFAARNRERARADLTLLGIDDSPTPPDVQLGGLRQRRPPVRPAVAMPFAEAAWTGLQSFTGEYRFQVEFPRAAGEVLRRITRTDRMDGDRIVVIRSDGEPCAMTYRYYNDNCMFRLNIPNDTSGVRWARENRDGIAIVRRIADGAAPLKLDIYPPGPETEEIIARSVSLGTWGRTATRVFGWF